MRALFLCLSLTAVAALGQPADPVPLKNWPAPISWRAEPPKAGAEPQLTTPGSATQLGVLVAITPCRLVDTRSNLPQPFGAGSSTPLTWTGGSVHSILSPSGSCSLPAATAYSVNITVWPQPSGTVLKWLSACPTGTSIAVCSAIATLTAYVGGTSGGTAAIVGNSAVIPANSSGSFDIYVTDPTWVIVDVNGYYVSPTALSLGGGTAGAPSLSFGTDATTGIFSSGTGTINVATAGVNQISVLSNGNIGIGTATPATTLEVNGNAQFDGNLNLAGSIFSPIGGAPLFTATPYSGSENSSAGSAALLSVTSGVNNVAAGLDALGGLTSGQANTAVGLSALVLGQTELSDTAIGQTSMFEVTGNGNTAAGSGTLPGTSVSNNIAVGLDAGQNLPGGNYNVYISSFGAGVTESGVIRIGQPGDQTSTYIAGIYGVVRSGSSPVYINSLGQLGTQASSRRYKEDIEDMGEASAGLMRLRPVTFHYQPQYDDPSHTLQYGLVAEEVAEVYPELAARSISGQIESVKYQFLAPMLLNEMQHFNADRQLQNDRVDSHDARLRSIEERLANIESLVRKLAANEVTR